MMRILFLGLAVLLTAMTSSAGPLPTKVKQQADLSVELRRGPLADWKAAFAKRDAGAFAKLCAEKAAIADWTGRLDLAASKDGIQEYRWKEAPAKDLSRADIKKAAAAYLAAYAKIEDVALTMTDLTWEPGESAASIELTFDLRGHLKTGERRTDRGTLEVALRKAGGSWKITKVADRGMETLQAKKPVFEDWTAKLGLAGVERHARHEAIRRGGYALAVADYDDSGSPSMYLGGSGNGQLYHRGADGAWHDVTKASGLGQDTMVKAAVFADFDNSGKTGLMVQRFVKEAGTELKFYKNAGNGKFVEAPAVVVRKAPHDRAMSMTAADFNGDGLIDLYVGYPGTRDFTDGRLDGPETLAHQAVYINKGGWKFEELIEAEAPRLSADVVRPHSALAVDFDSSGKKGILVVDDRGNSSKIYLNKGDERFKNGALDLGLQNQGWGMVAVAGDFNLDRKEDIYFTNVDFSAGHLLQRLLQKAGVKAQSDATFARAQNLFGGNRLYRGSPNGTYQEVTASAGVGWTGEAAAGAAWFDFNNDGLLDLYVANGLWSADPKKSYDDEFVRDITEGTTVESAEDDNPVMRRLQKTGESFGGYQRHRLYRNNGDNTFTEVGFVTNADRTEDGYVMAVTDLQKTGRADLVLRNADPADLKYGMLPVTILHNTGINENKSLAVLPRSKAGSPAFGARVIVTIAGVSQTRELRSVEGAVQNEPMVFIGLGTAAKADSVEVHWNSGSVSRFENVEAGRIFIDEGTNGMGRLAGL